MEKQATEPALLRAWRHRGPLACLLWPLSLLYGAASGLRRWLFQRGVLKSGRVGVPVVVVGNVVAGGSGKTPVVMALVRHLRARGLRVGVVSRGYGRRMPASGDDVREVSATSQAGEVGDEPLLIQRSCGVPVFVGRQRLAAAEALLARHPETEVIVSDDGLQHHAMQRDLEICVFDDRGVGNGWLLPAGPLREPWPRRVDLVLHTGSHPAFAGFRARRRLADEAKRQDGSRVALATLAGQEVAACAGIAQPEAFFAMLRARGLNLMATQALPDHSDFAGWQRPAPPGQPLLCTEKDAAKLWPLAPDALAVPLDVALDAGFLQAVDERLARLRAASVSSAPAPKRS